jgi:hypothetical protein
MAKKAKQYRKNKQVISHVKKQRGLDRLEFLETNGDMKQWIPPRIIIQDKRKTKNKRACRGKWHG